MFKKYSYSIGPYARKNKSLKKYLYKNKNMNAIL